MSDISNVNTKELYGKYKFSDAIFSNPQNELSEDSILIKKVPSGTSGSIREVYSIPIDSIKANVLFAEKELFDIKSNIEINVLRKLFVDPYIDPDLEQLHAKIWLEASKYMNLPDQQNSDGIVRKQPINETEQIFRIQPISDSDVDKFLKQATDEDNLENFPIIIDDTIYKNSIPNYISFDEYIFAEKYKSTACRRFIYEYEEAIAQQTFSYIYQFRKIIDILLNELQYIKLSLFNDFREEYQNDAQRQIATHYEAWAKTAIHYSSRIKKILLSISGEIPPTELDKISKKQAVEFQAFFAIRLNALNKEINDLIDAAKRESLDQAENFYTRFIHTSLRVFNEISSPLEFDYLYDKFLPRESVLVSELIVATNSIKGNFVAIHADVIERFGLLTRRIDAAINLIHEKRKYANYIGQLGNIAVKKKKVLKEIADDRYAPLFRSITINNDRNNNYTSEHSRLHGLLEDDHPQYLLKNNGTITGNIYVNDGIKIDGIDISEHSHTGSDGSKRIKSTDIDYDSPRLNPEGNSDLVIKPMSISIDGFQSDIIDAGVPVCDAIISIEIDDLAIGNYEYEIIYTEII